MVAKRNLALIVLDSVSRRVMELAKAPNLGKLYYYSNVWSNASWTLPSHTSMLTGLLPHEHGNTNYHWHLEKDVRYLPEELTKAGYNCYGYYYMPYLDGGYGFTRGFKEYKPYWREGLIPMDAIRAMESPFFLFLNVGFCHAPYRQEQDSSNLYDALRDFWKAPDQPNQPLFNWMKGRQIEAVQYCDAIFKEIRTALGKDALIIVTSDHGEMFGEGLQYGHSYSIDEKVVSVPFLSTERLSVAGDNMFDLRFAHDLLRGVGVDGRSPQEVPLAHPRVAVSEMMGCPVEGRGQEMRLAVRSAPFQDQRVIRWKEWRESPYDPMDVYIGDASLDPDSPSGMSGDAVFEQHRRDMVEYKKRLVRENGFLQNVIHLDGSDSKTELNARLKALGYL
jgi:hypothetical protein